MSEQPNNQASKPRKPKNWKHINGSCKMAKLSDGYEDKPCVHCGTVSKLKICGWCGKRTRKK